MSASLDPRSAPAAGRRPRAWMLALALSLGAAVSLGITRFAYALLLPPMREDLGWSYTLAGSMNTLNALGYLLGALATPWLLRRYPAGRLLLAGAVWATVFMGLSGFFTAAPWLLLQRMLAGAASAVAFVTGGLLAARMGAQEPARAGWLLGLYYGGTGWGISASALVVPTVLAYAAGPHAWAWAWWALAVVCALATVGLLWPVRVLERPGRVAGEGGAQQHAGPDAGAGAASPVGGPVGDASAGPVLPVPWRSLAPALLSYGLFGVGYIGYMTFVVALLRDQGTSVEAVTWFYALLGVSVVLSSRIWAGLLDRSRGGAALALLSALLGGATLLPALTSAWPVVLASGVLFGGVFLSLVASTTALVRHNLPAAQWAAGISGFTMVFALGQIVGPTVVGWIADGPGGLGRGLLFSAAALWLGAVVAWRQRPLPAAR